MRGVTVYHRDGPRLFHISTHTPHAGRDRPRPASTGSRLEFQLTRPMRGVTGWYKILDDSTNISTHTPHAGRDRPNSSALENAVSFQLTRPMRGVTADIVHCNTHYQFQLTRPMRGVTTNMSNKHEQMHISTHTPHAGRDCRSTNTRASGKNFNSHAPCGA